MTYCLSDFIDPLELSALVAAFARAADCRLLVSETKVDGTTACAGDAFCRTFPMHESPSVTCPLSMAVNESPAVGGSLLRCGPGGFDCVVPVTLGGEVIARLASGPFLAEMPDGGGAALPATRFRVDDRDYLAALETLPVLDEQRRADMLSFLVALSYLLGCLADERLRLRNGSHARAASGTDVADEAQQILRYRALLRHARDSVLFVRARDGRILDANPAAERAYGYTRAQLLDLDIHRLRHRDARPSIEADMAAVDASGCQFETIHVRRDGQTFPVEVGSARVELDGESVLLSIVRDISGRKKAQAKLNQLNEALQQGQEATLIYNRDLSVEYVNPAFCRLFGYDPQEIVGKSVALIDDPDDDGGPSQEMTRRYAIDHGHFRGEAKRRRKDGTLIPVLLSVAPVHGEEGEHTGYVSVMTDLSEIKQAQERLRRMAHYDSLTQLPNRKLFYDRLQLAATGTRRGGDAFALLFIDLDNFKSVNDALGHQSGDRLLQQVAQRLLLAVREQDTVARLGGDEFVILLPHCGDMVAAASAAAKVQHAFDTPFSLDDGEVRSGASIGIALYPSDAADVDALIQCADHAMYRSKRGGRRRTTFYGSQ